MKVREVQNLIPCIEHSTYQPNLNTNTSSMSDYYKQKVNFENKTNIIPLTTLLTQM